MMKPSGKLRYHNITIEIHLFQQVNQLQMASVQIAMLNYPRANNGRNVDTDSRRKFRSQTSDNMRRWKSRGVTSLKK